MSKVEKAIKKNNLAALAEMAEGKDENQRFEAILGLGQIGGDGAINYLVTKLNDDSPKTRIAIAQALGVIGDPHTKAHIAAQLQKETNPEVREAISKAMSHIREY